MYWLPCQLWVTIHQRVRTVITPRSFACRRQTVHEICVSCKIRARDMGEGACDINLQISSLRSRPNVRYQKLVARYFRSNFIEELIQRGLNELAQ
jgi:hypothetical protein